MSYQKETLFTIGQFAALHEINKKTLMWYDEIGLFRPAVIRENGYRCYTYQQSSMLETILTLRELNMSVKEIQHFMEHRSAAALEELYENKLTELDQKILHLQAVRDSLSQRKQDISALLHTDLSEIRLIEKEDCYLAEVRTSPDVPFEKEIEMVLKESKKRQLHHLRDTVYGSLLSTENLYHGNFEDYAALFIEIPNPTETTGLHHRPAGTYLRAFCKGSWDKIPDRYRELLIYAEEHHLIFTGYAYETGINEMAIDSMEEYITQIEIPVKKES